MIYILNAVFYISTIKTIVSKFKKSSKTKLSLRKNLEKWTKSVNKTFKSELKLKESKQRRLLNFPSSFEGIDKSYKD